MLVNKYRWAFSFAHLNQQILQSMKAVGEDVHSKILIVHDVKWCAHRSLWIGTMISWPRNKHYSHQPPTFTTLHEMCNFGNRFTFQNPRSCANYKYITVASFPTWCIRCNYITYVTYCGSLFVSTNRYSPYILRANIYTITLQIRLKKQEFNEFSFVHYFTWSSLRNRNNSNSHFLSFHLLNYFSTSLYFCFVSSSSIFVFSLPLSIFFLFSSSILYAPSFCFHSLTYNKI